MMENITNTKGPNDDGPSKNFHEPSQKQKGKVSFRADGTNQIQACSIGKKTKENDSLNERPRMMAKVASCPSNQIELFTNNRDGNHRQEKPTANRRRAQSMPAGSIASHDFFGSSAKVRGRTFIDTGRIDGLKMEKICENHSLRDETKQCNQKQRKQDPETAPENDLEEAKLFIKQADAFKNTGAPANDVIFQSGSSNQRSQKCDCVIL
ncbi:hypothetical protein ACHAXS_000636 [Conticribra weissflogii]